MDKVSKQVETCDRPLYEDELPHGYPYDAMFPYSWVDGVRLFPSMDFVKGFAAALAEKDKEIGELVEALENLALCGYEDWGGKWVNLQVSESEVLDARALLARYEEGKKS